MFSAVIGQEGGVVKGALGCLGVVAVLFALLFGLLWFVVSETDDQSDLDLECWLDAG